MSKNKKEVMTKTKHSSLDLPELEQPSSPKKTETRSKITENAIWSKLTIFSDSFKPKNHQQNELTTHKKSKTQTTLDYFLKSKPKDIKEKRQTISHPPNLENGRPSSLQKQFSVGSYPVLLNIPEESSITRDRPATVCGSNPGAEHKNTVAFNLDRPRKKLSFREPEISGYSKNVGSVILPKKNIKAPFTPQMLRSVSYNNEGSIHRSSSYENIDLEVRNIWRKIFK